jgi:trehalose/maltose hydrolase-like predicted phosphorylase
MLVSDPAFYSRKPRPGFNLTSPISPPPAIGGARNELPAYVSNGVIGLRVREMPLAAGLTLLSGYSGQHAQRQIEAIAVAPYPVAGDIQLGGVWLSDAMTAATVIDQSYDFGTGELASRFEFEAGGRKASVEVLVFCSRDEPTLVCQEITIELDVDIELTVKALLDARHVDGRALRHLRDTPGEDKPCCDGAALWESAGARSTCGIAYVTQLVGADAKPERRPLENRTLATSYTFKAQAAKTYRLRQIASLIPNVSHLQPDFQAVRLVTLAGKRGFETLRAANRQKWSELWKGRITLVGADRRWQALADAALFYLFTSTHVASPASTSIFGLATWHDYHYYYGHVMWDIETFVVPVLSLLQPNAAESILDYRIRSLPSAVTNARMRGRRGLQFPWESAPSGQEAAPLPGSASWHEDHVSLDVARAFAFHSCVTGDQEFLRENAWPVLSGVADWIVSRAIHSERGYELRADMGIAERETATDNAAFTNMAAVVVLRDAICAAEKLGRAANPQWARIAQAIVLPMDGRVIVSHDGYQPDEEKGGTPDPLMGIFPLGFDMEPEVEAATLKFYLDLRADYVGSPMLSALYGVWAAYTGDRALSVKLMEDGYGRFCVGRFLQTLEYREDVFPEQPRAGPFFANLGGFLLSLLTGFPGLQPGWGDAKGWTRRAVTLPEGWTAIEIERLWIGGNPYKLVARQGAEGAEITPLDENAAGS